MKKTKHSHLYISLSMLLAFVVWTLAVRFVDVRAIGPNGSIVGFATINEFFHRLTGVHILIYNITDWLGLVPIFVAMGFAFFGFVQLIKRKRFNRIEFCTYG